MSTKTSERLSSDFLYTYTGKLDNIKLMLKYGLRHSLNSEKVPYKNSIQQNFIICFCDILPEQADYHKSVYGNYSIAFTKEWGIRNAITPLRYIHKNSPGAQANYIKLKNDMRIARESMKDGNQLDYFLSLITFITAREKGLLTEDSIHDQQLKNPIDKYLEAIDKEFNAKMEIHKKETLMEIFNDWVIPILHLLEISVDELEKRDAFLRIYQDDFRDVKNKVLYDEREWRSVKYITQEEMIKDPHLYNDAITNKYLPESYNLHFETSDIHAVIVETDDEKNKLLDYVNAEIKHLKGIDDLVVTFKEHITNAKP